MNQSEQQLQNALLQLAFELGRNYEQIHQSLDLYNAINFDDMVYAQKMGAMFSIGSENQIQNVVKAKYALPTDEEQRKFRRLEELRKQVLELPDKFKITETIKINKMENDKEQPWTRPVRKQNLSESETSQWFRDLIKSYQNKEFSINDVVGFDYRDSYVYYIILDEISRKLKTRYISYEIHRNRTLLNEVEQKYYQQLDSVVSSKKTDLVKKEVKPTQLRLFED